MCAECTRPHLVIGHVVRARGHGCPHRQALEKLIVETDISHGLLRRRRLCSSLNIVLVEDKMAYIIAYM